MRATPTLDKLSYIGWYVIHVLAPARLIGFKLKSSCNNTNLRHSLLVTKIQPNLSHFIPLMFKTATLTNTTALCNTENMYVHVYLSHATHTITLTYYSIQVDYYLQKQLTFHSLVIIYPYIDFISSTSNIQYIPFKIIVNSVQCSFHSFLSRIKYCYY